MPDSLQGNKGGISQAPPSAKTIEYGHYAVARVRDGKVVECMATDIKLSEVLQALEVHRQGSHRERQEVRLLQRTVGGFKPVRLLGAII